jgi:hypothetical protein
MRLAIRMPSCLAGYEAMPRRGARACLVHWSVVQCNPQCYIPPLQLKCSPACMRTIPPVCSCAAAHRTGHIRQPALPVPLGAAAARVREPHRMCARAGAQGDELATRIGPTRKRQARRGIDERHEGRAGICAGSARRAAAAAARGAGARRRLAVSAADSRCYQPCRLSRQSFWRETVPFASLGTISVCARYRAVRDTAPCGIPCRAGYRAVRDRCRRRTSTVGKHNLFLQISGSRKFYLFQPTDLEPPGRCQLRVDAAIRRLSGPHISRSMTFLHSVRRAGGDSAAVHQGERISVPGERLAQSA